MAATSCHLLLILLVASATCGAMADYDHVHRGEDWGGVCATGKRQSPVNIYVSKTVQNAALGPLEFQYQEGTKYNVSNKRHTIQVDFPAGSKITLPSYFKPADYFLTGEKVTMPLAQFHLHAFSEHKINDAHFAMEGHFVHAIGDGPNKRIAVVGLFFEFGEYNQALADVILSKAPATEDVNQATLSKEFDFESILPNDKNYYTYPGSLTTPTCDEIVTWFVLKQPVNVSKEQVQQFKKLLVSATGVYQNRNNYRFTQPLNGRVVQASSV